LEKAPLARRRGPYLARPKTDRTGFGSTATQGTKGSGGPLPNIVVALGMAFCRAMHEDSCRHRVRVKSS
jgi:hypothetical protein